MANPNDDIDLELELIDQSDDAFQVSVGDETWWVPKSLCSYDEMNGWLTIPEWLALEKGMI